ncbi:replication protein [Heyndrickxia oleronia]|uniref:replication protein n=1 Tax=Heyndrickxia oleronia TaxID=38875 RepID=UPI00204263FF|nr:replication protein [Heyndrickxia oleronia]MCM3456571.1 replication protein [Heyndrickxia oleronia]
MANPQVEKGHTRIANEILENIMKTNLNGTQFRIVLAIWRNTYGFQETTHEMSISYLANAIDANKSQVDRELTSLINRNIIKVIGIGSRGARIMGFNKDYDKWGNPIAKEIPQDKQTKKPSKVKKYEEDNSYYKMAVYFHEKISKVAKDAGVEHLVKKANLQSYADDFRKLIELDGVNKRLVKDVMDWVTQDSFWRTNILSAKKLREKFTELAIKMNAQKQPKSGSINQQSDPRDKEIEFQKWLEDGGEPDAFNWGT